VPQVLRASQAIKVLLDLKVPQVRQAYRDPQVSKDLRVLLEYKDLKAQLVQLVYKDSKEPQAPLV
jgi:hypothetical protein